MAVKFVPKRYSPGEIEALKKNPNVLEVRENRLLLTIEFRQQVYEAWIRRPERSTVRRMLEANGFDTQRLGLNFTKSVESVFKRGGRPKFSKASPETQANWAKTIYMPTMTAEELVESGKFVWDVNRLILHPDFEAELYRNYPQQSIEDGLLSVGISPADMGYHKIYWLQEKFEHSSGQDTNRSATRGRTAYYTAATVEQYRKHPYVQTATREKIELNKAFFEAAAPIAVLAFDDILRVFDIDPEIFSVTERYRMSRVLAAWATPADRETINASPTRKILRNRMRALDSIVEKGFLQIGDIVSSLNVLQKKSLCLWLRDLPPDPGRKYSVRKILSHEDFSCVILCHTEEWHLWTVGSTEKRTRRAGCRTDSNRYGIQGVCQRLKADLYDDASSDGKAYGAEKDTPYYENVQPHIVDSEGSAFQAHGWSGTEKECET